MNEEKLLQEIEDLKQRIDGLEATKKAGAFRRFVGRSFSKMNVLVGVGITVLITSLIAYAAQISFQDGELIVAEDVNANFTELYDRVGALESDPGTVNNVITASVTKTVGTGGDFANFIEANEWLQDKMIAQGAIVTLQLTGDLTLSDPASYTWSDGFKAGIHIEHRDGNRIIIDLGGYTLTVGNGTDSVYGIFINKGCYLTVKSGMLLSENNEGGTGIAASQGSRIFVNSDVFIGSAIKGFRYGIEATYNSFIFADGVTIQGCFVYGILAYHSSCIRAQNSVSNNNHEGYRAELNSFIDSLGSTTNCGWYPAQGTESNDHSYIR